MTTREHLERLYAEVCGPSLVYTRTDAELADEIIARWREARHDAAAELRTLWGGAK